MKKYNIRLSYLRLLLAIILTIGVQACFRSASAPRIGGSQDVDAKEMREYTDTVAFTDTVALDRHQIAVGSLFRMMEKGLHFEDDEVQVQESHKQRLDSMAVVLRESPFEISFYIVSHYKYYSKKQSRKLNRDDNRALSRARIHNVRNYLILQGVDPHQLNHMGKLRHRLSDNDPDVFFSLGSEYQILASHDSWSSRSFYDRDESVLFESEQGTSAGDLDIHSAGDLDIHIEIEGVSPTSSFYGITKPESLVMATVDDHLKDIKEGHMAYHVPDTLMLNNPVVVSLIISKNVPKSQLKMLLQQSTSFKSNPDTTRTILETIKLSNMMKARFYAVDDSAFLITLKSELVQAVDFIDTSYTK